MTRAVTATCQGCGKVMRLEADGDCPPKIIVALLGAVRCQDCLTNVAANEPDKPGTTGQRHGESIKDLRKESFAGSKPCG